MIMKRRQVELADGRYLVYYTFDDARDEAARPEVDEPKTRTASESPAENGSRDV